MLDLVADQVSLRHRSQHVFQVKLRAQPDRGVDIVRAICIEDRRSLTRNNIRHRRRLGLDCGLLREIATVLLPLVPLFLIRPGLGERIPDHLRRLHARDRSLVALAVNLLGILAEIEDHRRVEPDDKLIRRAERRLRPSRLENPRAPGNRISRPRRDLERRDPVAIYVLIQQVFGVQAIAHIHIRGIRVSRLLLILIGRDVVCAGNPSGRIRVDQSWSDVRPTDHLIALRRLQIRALPHLIDLAVADKHHPRSALRPGLHGVKMFGNQRDVLRPQRRRDRQSRRQQQGSGHHPHCAPACDCGYRLITWKPPVA